ncbi:unnamed protein product, partial [Polarella glacialis]
MEAAEAASAMAAWAASALMAAIGCSLHSDKAAREVPGTAAAEAVAGHRTYGSGAAELCQGGSAIAVTSSSGDQVAEVGKPTEEEPMCRICLEGSRADGDNFLTPCRCSGTQRLVP